MLDNKNFLWTEKYRPNRIEDCILPSSLKTVFQKFVDDKNVPNLLLCGGAGLGKTTVAKAMLDELGCDWLMINGSNEGRLVDTLRNDIRNFAGTLSFTGGRKYIILDEADYLNPTSVQPGLRNFMEEYSKNCGFILTCNFKNRIIDPLHSRCSVIDFKIPANEKETLAKQFLKRIINILEIEKVEYDKRVIAEIIMKYFPDWRRVLNELQRYAAHGRIDNGILANNDDTEIKDLIAILREKNFTGMRSWVGENSAMDFTLFFRKIYDSAHNFVAPNSIPPLVLILADYQYKAAFVSDQEVNTVACLTQIMIDCEFK